MTTKRRNWRRKKRRNPFVFYSLIIIPSKLIIAITNTITITITITMTIATRMRTRMLTTRSRRRKRKRKNSRNPIVFYSLMISPSKILLQ